jgi:peptidoglycan/LPS O-acetylase OafA/YrhL
LLQRRIDPFDNVGDTTLARSSPSVQNPGDAVTEHRSDTRSRDIKPVEPSRQGARQIFWSIQYLRGLAAAAVVVFHATTGSLAPAGVQGFELGAHGVDIFFVISGFIMFAAARNESVVRFWTVRVIRIYPLYWMALFATILFNQLTANYGLSGREVLASILLWPMYSFGHPDEIWPILVPGWTLTYELLFYAIFSIGLLTRRVVAVPVAMLLLLVVAGQLLHPHAASLVVATSPLLTEFVIGLLLGVLVHRRALTLPLLLVVWGLAATAFWYAGFGRALIMTNAGGIVAAALLAEPLIVRSQSQFLKLLGDASYAIYLVHTIVFGLADHFLLDIIERQGVGVRWGIVAVTIVLATFAGILVHILIERPMLKRLRPLGDILAARFPWGAGDGLRGANAPRNAPGIVGDEGRSILFVSRLPPDADGPGGTQRAMQLLRSLAAQGTVDLVLLHRASDIESVSSLAAEGSALVRHFASLEIADWAPAKQSGSKILWQLRQTVELLRIHAPDAPRFSRRTIDCIAASLPKRHYDVVFAGRLSSACIVDQLIDNAELKAHTRIVDLDDLVSRFRERELEVAGPKEGRLRRFLQRIVIRRVRAAELSTCRNWNVVGLPVAQELEWLRSRVPAARLQLMPNVIERPYLPAPTHHRARILFVGHLAYPPNVDGLRAFLEGAWPIVRSVLPEATLAVVGMYPDAAVADMVDVAGAQLHANVPSVEPYYRDCQVVISPIRYASGTRIKIIEAMAFGRAVVSTTVGAEGLAIEAGRHALIADDMVDFAQAVIRLCTDPVLNASIVAEGYDLQQKHYSLAALAKAISDALAATPARKDDADARP